MRIVRTVEYIFSLTQVLKSTCLQSGRLFTYVVSEDQSFPQATGIYDTWYKL